MEILNIILLFIEIIVTIFGVVIPIKREIKSRLPRLIIGHFFIGEAPSEEKDKEEGTVLHGYFQAQREFDEKLHAFLKANDSDFMFSNNFMQLVVNSYREKNYYVDSNLYPTKKVNEILVTFEKNPKFIKLINEYIAYERESRWVLKITNVGETAAYDLTIDLFTENNSAAKFLNGTLKSNHSKRVVIYYFDKSAVVDIDNKNIYWKNENNTIFYLVDEKKYNKKDERLFLITYKDIYSKYHKVYCCSKISKNELHNIMGAK